MKPSALEPLDVGATFDGKNILLIGTTGFVGKVVLSMLLRHYPNVGKVFALVRAGAGYSAENRFFDKVAASPAFDPLREVWQDGYDSFMREKVVPIPGDIGKPLCSFDDAVLARFDEHGGLDAIINSAGLVSFTPSLESAIRINSLGARHVLEAARKTGAHLLHISTCYVAGKRDGEAAEDEPVVGYFPRHDEINTRDFSAEDEIADCLRIIEQVRAQANDRAHISRFREMAAESLREQRRDPDDEATLKLAVARERKLWVSTRLRDLGQERAEHWGWTNTYTYTKSLGEQIILAAADVRAAVLRPAIVESAVRYPFAGWNEGFNTTAPLVYLVLKGHRQIVAGHRTPLDIIPVDMVAAGIIQATAALLAGRSEPVYQCGTSDVNPVYTSRLTELTALAVRRHFRKLAEDGEKPVENRIRARLEAFPVTDDRFQRLSAPQIKRAVDWASDEIDRRLPRWGAPRLTALAERTKDELGRVSDFTGQVTDLIDLFKPFTFDHTIRFRCDNTRALNAQLTVQDQQALRWDPEAIDWRHYWFDSHFPGLQKWVFPVLDDEFGPKQRSIYTHKDLLELFDATTKLHKHRVAMRMLPARSDDGDEHGEPVVYTYARVQDMAEQGAGSLRERGIEPGDRVMLMSENRPEWGISYFAVLKAGATAVPVDSQLTLAEVQNLLRASGARMLIASTKVTERLARALGDEQGGAQGGIAGSSDVQVVGFDDVLAEPSVSPAAVKAPRRSDGVASIIYTSGTTGAPKGVMLTHKNLTFMAAKMSSVFKLYLHDSVLSVLPLHHTFEFSTGLVMPLLHGSSVSYLEEIGADTLGTALEEGNITAMVGVPALWQLLHRKIFKTVSEQGILVERAFETIVRLSRTLRERSGLNLGRLLFFPVHRRLGGRMRLLISGGSALPTSTLESFHGLGFQLLEGYGMTESAPVLTTMRPGERTVSGSVGRALPGIDVKIFEPDERGVGEIVARGANIMAGYYENPEATAETLREGWLHTGDLGRIDDDGNVFIVGRKKEMILGPSGENVYPDELEEVYRDSPHIKELSIVGLPAEGGGETVAALVVPDYEQDDRQDSRESVRERVREHMRSISKQLPLYKRVKTFHLWDHDLPKTTTRKVKRREVVAELQRIERTLARAGEAQRVAGEAGAGMHDSAWVREVIAQVTQKGRAQVKPETRLQDLGFDSLMFTELGVSLEAAGVTVPDPSDLSDLETVADVEAYLAQHGAPSARKRVPGKPKDETADADEIHVPEVVARVGRRGLRLGQRMVYERVFDTKLTGRVHVPPFGGYIVAANHASHLDMGLVKHALGEQGELLVALAAKDYFFEDPVRKAYFENFTNLVPMERYGSLRESLRLAGQVLRDGHILLIFPEGTRSESGVMSDFKPSLGFLAMANQCGILPMYLAGTHDALPKGAYVPKQRNIGARIGPFQTYEALHELAAGKARSTGYRAISTNVERLVRRLVPGEYAWTLGEAGREAVADRQAAPDEQEVR